MRRAFFPLLSLLGLAACSDSSGSTSGTTTTSTTSSSSSSTTTTSGGGSSSTTTTTTTGSGGAGGAGGAATTSSTTTTTTTAGSGGAGGSPAGGQALWSERSGDVENQAGGPIACDPSGNLWLGGSFTGNLDFGGGPLSAGAAGVYALYLAKLDKNGQHLFSTSFDTGITALSYSTDGASSLVFAGQLSKAVSFGGPVLSPDPSGKSFYLAKLAPGGAHVFSKRFVLNFGLGLGRLVVTGDPAGNTFVAGSVSGKLDLGDGSFVQTNANAVDLVVLKYDPGGTRLWSKHFAGTAIMNVVDVVADGAGNVVLGASAAGGFVDFGSGPVATSGSDNIALAKLDGSGAVMWSKMIGAKVFLNDIAVDPAGAVILGGKLQGTADFGGGPLVADDASDAWMAKLDAAGAHVLSKRFGGPGSQTTFGVAGDAAGQVLLAGLFNPGIDLGGGPLAGTGPEGFFARLDGAGNHLWSHALGTMGGLAQVQSIQVDAMNEVFLSGSFSGTLDIGNGPRSTTGINDQDVLVARVSP